MNRSFPQKPEFNVWRKNPWIPAFAGMTQIRDIRFFRNGKRGVGREFFLVS
jgi:hypothetical protein